METPRCRGHGNTAGSTLTNRGPVFSFQRTPSVPLNSSAEPGGHLPMAGAHPARRRRRLHAAAVDLGHLPPDGPGRLPVAPAGCGGVLTPRTVPFLCPRGRSDDGRLLSSQKEGSSRSRGPKFSRRHASSMRPERRQLQVGPSETLSSEPLSRYDGRSRSHRIGGSEWYPSA